MAKRKRSISWVIFWHGNALRLHGQAGAGFDIDIIDDDGNRMPDDEVGHIAIRTEGSWPPGLFDGYYTGGAPDTESFAMAGIIQAIPQDGMRMAISGSKAAPMT